MKRKNPRGIGARKLRKVSIEAAISMLIVLTCSPLVLQPVSAPGYMSKWEQIQLAGSNYNVYVVSGSELTDIFKRPLWKDKDTSITQIYVTDSWGTKVTDKRLIRQIVIDAQNVARLTKSISDYDFETPVSLALQMDTRLDVEKLAKIPPTVYYYKMYVPVAMEGWWKDIFIYDPLCLGLDLYSARVDSYANVFLEIALQTALHDKLSDDPALMEELSALLSDTDTTMDWAEKIMAGEQLFHADTTNVRSLLEVLDAQKHTVNEKVLDQFGRLTSVVSAMKVGIDVTYEALRSIMLTALATAQAEQRLDIIGEYVEHNAAFVDTAITDGLNEAKERFQIIANAFYNTVDSILRSVENNFVDIVYVTGCLASAFGLLGPEVAQIALPYYLSYEVYRALAESIDNMKSAACVATIHSMISGRFSSTASLRSYRMQLSEAEFADDDLLESSMELNNINHYLGFYFHQRIAEGMNLPIYRQLADFIANALGGMTVSDAIAYNEQRADEEAQYTLETRDPWHLCGCTSFGWDDADWLLEKAGAHALAEGTTTTIAANPKSVDAGETSVINIIVKDTVGHAVPGGSVYIQCEAGQLGTGGASITLPLSGGQVSTTWIAPTTADTYSITVFYSGYETPGAYFRPSQGSTSVDVVLKSSLQVRLLISPPVIEQGQRTSIQVQVLFEANFLSGAFASATATKPDGTTETLLLKSMESEGYRGQFQGEYSNTQLIGTYTVSVVASKPGYTSGTTSKTFLVQTFPEVWGVYALEDYDYELTGSMTYPFYLDEVKASDGTRYQLRVTFPYDQGFTADVLVNGVVLHSDVPLKAGDYRRYHNENFLVYVMHYDVSKITKSALLIIEFGVPTNRAYVDPIQIVETGQSVDFSVRIASGDRHTIYVFGDIRLWVTFPGIKWATINDDTSYNRREFCTDDTHFLPTSFSMRVSPPAGCATGNHDFSISALQWSPDYLNDGINPGDFMTDLTVYVSSPTPTMSASLSAFDPSTVQPRENTRATLFISETGGKTGLIDVFVQAEDLSGPSGSVISKSCFSFGKNHFDVSAGVTLGIEVTLQIPASAILGDYSGSLAISSINGQSVKLTIAINVEPILEETRIFVSATPTDLTIGSQSAITISVVDTSNVPVLGGSVYLACSDGSFQNGHPTIILALSCGTASATWTSSSAGIHTIRVVFADCIIGNINYRSSSDSISIIMNKTPTFMTVWLATQSTYYGSNLTIEGKVSAQVSDGTVAIEYSEDGSSWTVISAGVPKNGEYSCTWTPSVVGKLYVRAEWSGNSIYEHSTSPAEGLTVLPIIWIDKTLIVDSRVDVNAPQTVGFHAIWSHNGTDACGGCLWINETRFVTNNTGWVTFDVNYDTIGKRQWAVTNAQFNLQTAFETIANDPWIVWDRVRIIDGGVTNLQTSITQSEIVWFRAVYEFDETTFDASRGILFLNNSPMTWSDSNERWEYTYALDYPASVQFKVSGVYDAFYGLTVFNDQVGAKSISWMNVMLDNTDPIASAGLDRTANEDTSITLDASASTDNIGITGYKWTFTDMTIKTLTGDKPAYTFSNPGVYMIILNVTDAAGNWAIDTVIITVLDVTKPIADARQDQTANMEATVSFDAGDSTDNVGIVSYYWDFGDGTTAIGKTTTHTYSSVRKSFSVTLTVADAAGNIATDTTAITVETQSIPILPGDDNDGIPSRWEMEHGLDPLDAADAFLDPDGDGLTNLQEYQDGTDPNASDAQPFLTWAIAAAIISIIGVAAAATLLLRRRK